MYTIFELNEKSLDDLKLIATEMGIDDENKNRTDLIYAIIDHEVDHPDIKKGTKSKKKQKSVKAQKDNNSPAEPIVAGTEQKPQNEAVAEPELTNPDEKQGKRSRRPRISKNAESAPTETQTASEETHINNKVEEPVQEPVVETPAEVAAIEKAEEEQARMLETERPFREQGNRKQKRKRIQEAPNPANAEEPAEKPEAVEATEPVQNAEQEEHHRPNREQHEQQRDQQREQQPEKRELTIWFVWKSCSPA